MKNIINLKIIIKIKIIKEINKNLVFYVSKLNLLKKNKNRSSKYFFYYKLLKKKKIKIIINK